MTGVEDCDYLATSIMTRLYFRWVKEQLQST